MARPQNMRSIARAVSRDVLDLLFPIACVGCGKYTAGSGEHSDAARWLCVSCRGDIRLERSSCIVCGAYSPTGRTCPRCSTETPLTGVVALGQYANPTLRAAVMQLKFKGIRALAEPLGELLARRLVAAGIHRAPTTPMLVPIPLSKARERERGFNQAWLLGEVIGKQVGIPVERPLVRTRNTAHQTSILESPQARRRNVAGAFAIRSSDAGNRLPARVILVDDVLTTGATMTEAASILAAAGVTEIWAAVVARG